MNDVSVLLCTELLEVRLIHMRGVWRALIFLVSSRKRTQNVQILFIGSVDDERERKSRRRTTMRHTAIRTKHHPS